MLPDQKVVKDVISLTLVGRGAVNYGTDFAENFVHLLENFAHVYPPQRGIEGQLWWNTSKFKLMVYTSGEWKQVTEDGTPEAIPDTLVRRDANADFRARIVKAALNGNADTATKWQTARTIIIQGDVRGSSVIDGTNDAVLNVHADRADVTDRLSSARRFAWTGDATGELYFNGTGDVQTALTVHRAATADKVTNSRQISLSNHITATGRFDGGADLNLVATLNDTGVTPGTYNQVTVDRNGRVTAAANVPAVTRVPEADHAARADRAANADRADNASSADRAGTADRLTAARRISLSGKVTGSAVFDGSNDIEIVTTGADTPQGDDKTSATNIGSGQGHVFAGMNGPQLQFKTLIAGDNVSITETGDIVRINSTAQISGTVDRAREADHATNADYAETAKTAEVALTARNVDLGVKSVTNINISRTTGLVVKNPNYQTVNTTEAMRVTMPNAGYARIIQWRGNDLTQYSKTERNAYNGSTSFTVNINGAEAVTQETAPDVTAVYTYLGSRVIDGYSIQTAPNTLEMVHNVDLSGQPLTLILNALCRNNGQDTFTFGQMFVRIIVFIK